MSKSEEGSPDGSPGDGVIWTGRPWQGVEAPDAELPTGMVMRSLAVGFLLAELALGGLWAAIYVNDGLSVAFVVAVFLISPIVAFAGLSALAQMDRRLRSLVRANTRYLLTPTRLMIVTGGRRLNETWTLPTEAIRDVHLLERGGGRGLIQVQYRGQGGLPGSLDLEPDDGAAELHRLLSELNRARRAAASREPAPRSRNAAAQALRNLVETSVGPVNWPTPAEEVQPSTASPGLGLQRKRLASGERPTPEAAVSALHRLVGLGSGDHDSPDRAA